MQHTENKAQIDSSLVKPMEYAIGVAGGAIAPPDLNLVGQPILYAPPDF